MIRNWTFFNKHKLRYHNFIPALKLRTKSINKIVDNRDELFLNYTVLISLRHVDVTVMGLNRL